MNNRGIILSLLIIFSVLYFVDTYRDKDQRQEQQYPTTVVPTLDMVEKNCFFSEVNSSQSCRYTIGTDLEFTIWQVGDPMTSVTVEKTKGELGDYQVRFTHDSPCLIVRTGKLNDIRNILSTQERYAFVSLTNGEVYSDLNECLGNKN